MDELAIYFRRSYFWKSIDYYWRNIRVVWIERYSMTQNYGNG